MLDGMYRETIIDNLEYYFEKNISINNINTINNILVVTNTNNSIDISIDNSMSNTNNTNNNNNNNIDKKFLENFRNLLNKKI